ncbi:MAG TPA: ABC transporter substrate-binding protein [Clostridia bacterium]|nr:ABC transporter substrate-binding protein [Clostridia bacterium]
MMKRRMGMLILLTIAAALLVCSACAGAAPIPEDGLYSIGVTSSSDMFKVVDCILHVEDGAITAVLTLSGHGYGYLYVGTGEEADAAPQSAWVPFMEDADGAYTYAIVIPELDADLSVAAYSIKYSKWYDRTLNFQSGSLRDYNLVPKDGAYAVTASSKTLDPVDCTLQVRGGAMTARFSLEGVDALRVNGLEYAADGSAFSIAIPSLDKAVAVEARAGGAWGSHSLLFRSGTLSSLTIVPDDGVYAVSVRSDSNLFPVTGCTLTVEGGKMTARLTVGSPKYDCIYVGTAKDALRAVESDRIPAVADGDSAYVYAVPIDTLDQEIPITTWSAKKSQWYDRVLTFDSATLTPQEESDALSFAFTGGTGRVSITCPGIVRDSGRTMATLVFSSSNYTYVEVGGTRYLNANAGGDSTFEIPVTLNGTTEIQAETTAMGNPHVIQYTLYLYTDGTDASQAAGKNASDPAATPAAAVPSEPSKPSGAPAIEGLAYASTLTLEYAQCFAAYFYEDGYAVLRVNDGRDYLVVPEGKSVPEGIGTDYIVLQRPLDRIYLAATSAMCLFDTLDELDAIRFSAAKAEDWYVERAVLAMEAGEIRYAGKYLAPDFELLLAGECDLAVESTMILHAPDAQEKLEELGIPVFIDLSSYEPEPLGRTEWIKAYAVLLENQDAAEKAFALQKSYLNGLQGFENTGLTVAYFYVNSSGLIVTKSPSDYFVKMIELAGGRYSFANLNDSEEAPASVTIDPESFYAVAKDADFLIYNASIDNPPASTKDLVGMNEMFADFKAVREGHVWCTTKSLYQSSNAIGQIVSDLHAMLTGDSGSLTFLHPMD